MFLNMDSREKTADLCYFSSKNPHNFNGAFLLLGIKQSIADIISEAKVS